MENERLHDKDIREPLFTFLEETFGKVRIIEEKMIGRSRADCIMVTEGALVGIEIKSDADTFTRLATQVTDYDRYYDYNIAAVGVSHVMHIGEHIPPYWGIITVENTGDGPDFYLLRKPLRNPYMQPKRKISILWRPELAAIQEKYRMPRYERLGKALVAAKIVETVPPEALAREISSQLFERDYTTIGETIAAYRKEHAPARRKTKKKRRAGRRLL